MNKVSYFTRILTNSNNKHIINKVLRRQCSILKREDVKNPQSQITRTVEEIDFESEIKELKIVERESILQPLSEDISHIGPYVKPTFNFAAYINKSETLQKLVDLGVDLHRIEQKKEAPEFILKLDFEKDIKPHIFLLHDFGVSSEELGSFITTNPYIFQEELETLIIRINYLQSKQFNKSMITRIVTKNPYWLMFSTKRIDSRLGHFQKTFNLTGNEVRKVTTKQPKLITYNMEHIKLNTFSIKEEMGFEDEDMKKLLLDIPKLWMMSQKSILDRFDYIHNTMKISHEQILQMPKVFTSRRFRIQHRHQFLEKLGRAQYDPKREQYVSLQQLVQGTDAVFCANVAKSSVQAYNTFLKSL